MSKKAENFNRCKRADKYIDFNKNSHIHLDVRRSKFPKRIRITIANFDTLNHITISNLTLKDGKEKLLLDKMDVNGAEVIGVNNKTIKIIPKSPEVCLTYPDVLNIAADIDFDIRIFIIILILVYLFTLKLTNYIVEFNTIKGYPKQEVAFLAVFFIFMLIPMSYINQDEISIKEENRILAKWQPLINENEEVNYNFGKSFDSWFNDRFNFRNKFIYLYNNITYKLFEKTNGKGFYDKKTGFMHLNGEFKYFDEDEINKNLYYLVKYRDYLKEHNIKLYVLIVPSKAQIYKTDIKKFNKKDVKNFEQHIKFLNKKSGLKIIFPYEALLKGAEDNYMFFQTEHHWTDDGAYIGFLELMKEIKKDYPDIEIPDRNDYNFSYNNLVNADFDDKYYCGQTVGTLGLLDYCEKFHKVQYRYYQHKYYNNLNKTIVNIPYHRYKKFNYPYGYDKRVLLLGTSQSENLTEFIPFVFKNVKRLRNNVVKMVKPEEEFKIMKYYEDEILDYKPDILIFCITYNNVSRLSDLFNME